MPDADVEVTANFKGIPTLNIGDHVIANIKDSDAPGTERQRCSWRIQPCT